MRLCIKIGKLPRAPDSSKQDMCFDFEDRIKEKEP